MLLCNILHFIFQTKYILIVFCSQINWSWCFQPKNYLNSFCWIRLPCFCANSSFFTRLSSQSYSVITILVLVFRLTLKLFEHPTFLLFLRTTMKILVCFLMFWQKSPPPYPYSSTASIPVSTVFPRHRSFFVIFVEKTPFTVTLHILRCGQGRANYCTLNGTVTQPAPRGYLYETTVNKKSLYFWIYSSALSHFEHVLSFIPLDTSFNK